MDGPGSGVVRSLVVMTGHYFSCLFAVLLLAKSWSRASVSSMFLAVVVIASGSMTSRAFWVSGKVLSYMMMVAAWTGIR